jgi:hypothetical protein
VARRAPQAQILSAFLGVDIISAEAAVSAALDDVWTVFRDLKVMSPHPSNPNEFQIDYQALIVRLPDQWFACSRCGILTSVAIHGKCYVAGCGGDLDAITSEDLANHLKNNHWFHRYTALPAASFKSPYRKCFGPSISCSRQFSPKHSRSRPTTINTGWRNASFRGYADYMQTPEFSEDLIHLVEIASPGAHCDHVRRGCSLAMPPFTDRRRFGRARHSSTRHPGRQ